MPPVHNEINNLHPDTGLDAEARFQALFDQVPVSMQLLAANGQTTQVNKAWENLWQVSDGDGIKAHVLSTAYNVLTDPQLEMKGIAAFLRRAFAGESVTIPPIYYDPAALGNFGRARWVTAHAHPMKDKEGRVQQVMLIHEDITERIIAENTVRESEERFRSLVMATSQIVWRTTPDGHLQEDSPSWRAFTGQTYEQFKDAGWLDAIHPDDRDATGNAWAASVASGQLFETEYRVRHADGAYRWTAVKAVPILQADGAVREWIGANTDIHPVKLAQAELAQRLANKEQHATLLGKVANASRMLNVALSIEEIAQSLVHEVRTILDVKQAMVTLTASDTGLQIVQAMSLSASDAHDVTDDVANAVKAAHMDRHALVSRTNTMLCLNRQALARQPASHDVPHNTGQLPQPANWLGVPLIDRNGKNLGVIGAADKNAGDFTEEDQAILTQLASIAANGFKNARLYLALQEQDRRKDEFLAMLAHELRNPLAPISAAADLLAFANLDQSRVKRTSDVITRQVRHMTGLVDDLLDVSRVTRGLITLNQVPIDVKRLVADAVEQVRPLMEAKQHYLIVESAPDAIEVLGDEKRLVQVLTNLLHNAAKYTPEGGRILLRMASNDEHVQIHVADNGIGIAPAVQRHVFELFAQAERTSDRSQGGLGIGLALVKSLVGLHDGTITLVSEGIGKGSAFTVSLPLLTAQQPALADQPGTVEMPAPPRTLRILVVDDNTDAADMLAMYLQLAGHDVLVENSARGALARALSDLPDVCVLDIGLPEMDGNELARRLRAQSAKPGLVLIALTGYGQEQDRHNAAEAGFDHHFVKPADMARLTTILDELALLE